MNGSKGDDPILDITHHKMTRFSPVADARIAQIVQIVQPGGRRELESAFDLFPPPPLSTFENQFKDMRDRILGDRKQRGREA